MRTLQGIALSPGFAEGVAVVYDFETDHRLEFPDRDISPAEIGAEHGRLEDAMEESHRELKQAEQTTNGSPDESVGHPELEAFWRHAKSQEQEN